MLKTNPLAKFQAIFALIFGFAGILVIAVNGNAEKVWFFVTILSFMGLSGITFCMGWLMIVRKTVVLYPHEVYFIRRQRCKNNQKRAYRLQKNAEGEQKRIYFGILNLIAGFLCLLLVVVIIVVMLVDPKLLGI